MKQKLYSYCLKGDINKAYEYLLSLDHNTGLEKLKNKYANRFLLKNQYFDIKQKMHGLEVLLEHITNTLDPS